MCRSHNIFYNMNTQFVLDVCLPVRLSIFSPIALLYRTEKYCKYQILFRNFKGQTCVGQQFFNYVCLPYFYVFLSTYI